MEIAFRIRNVEVPDSLRRATGDKVARLGARCGVDRADVCFSEERNPRIAERAVCDITLFAAGAILRAHAAATEPSVAAERVVGKLEHRADRFRGRGRGRSVHFPATRSSAGTVDHLPGGRTEPLTPEEAALEMGEQGNDIFFFLNAETGRPAVVRRRIDGAIALVVL
jgi:putative sigma-54 modulation protein